MLVGAPVAGRVLIVDDVISAGTSVRESIALIEAAGATPCAVAIALDRRKATDGGRDAPWSAVQFVERELGLKVAAIATLNDLLHYTYSQAGTRLWLRTLSVWPNTTSGVTGVRGEHAPPPRHHRRRSRRSPDRAGDLPGCPVGRRSAGPPAPIYSCVDANGRKLTSDRPIAECANRDQKLLNADGSVKVVPPNPTGG